MIGPRLELPKSPPGALAAALLALAAPAVAFGSLTLLSLGSQAISGVCPDGSIFIVQDASAIPCPGAKRVDPNEIPPLTPEFLPRPYGWEVFNRETDPNNPYNLVGVGRPGEAGAPQNGTAPAPSAPPQAGALLAPTAPEIASVPAPAVAAPPPPQQRSARALELSDSELRDLVAIIEVLQERAPATLVQRDAEDRPGLQLRLARSAAFEARLVSALTARGVAPAGPVLAYHVRADAPGAFWGNLTFVQGHQAYTPDPQDPTQFGVVSGELGELPAGGSMVGYAVLPGHADLHQPIDVYWNDRRLTAVLNP